MLVPKMNPIKIYDEISKDLPYILNKIIPYSERYHKTRKKNKIGSSKLYCRWYKLKIPSTQNSYYLLFKKAPEHKKYKDIKSTAFSMLTLLQQEKGYRVFEIMPTTLGAIMEGLCIYNSHLFSRYRERMKIDLNGIELIKNFFESNGEQMAKISDDNNILAFCSNGALLGRYFPEHNSLVYNTFISKEMQFYQQIQEREIAEGTNKNMLSELIQKNDFDGFDQLEYNFLKGSYNSIFE